MRSVFRKTAEPGHRGERNVHAKARGCAAVGFDPATEVDVERRRIDQPQIQELRIDVGNHARSGDLRSVREGDAGGAHAAGRDARDGRIGENRHASCLRFPRHRLRDRAHASHRVSPLPPPAVHFAENVV